MEPRPVQRRLAPAAAAAWITCCAWMLPGLAAEIPKAPVPKSPYIAVVYRYADAMVKSGRDQRGPQPTGLLLSALDRHTLAPLTNRPAAPEGVLSGDRVGTRGGPLAGANPLHDENLLRLLSTLTDLSAKPQYRAAADAELKWFLEQARRLDRPWPWDWHSWDVMRDEIAPAPGDFRATPLPFRPWLLWDRCFALAPEASRELVARAVNAPESQSPRGVGFCVRALAAAYQATREPGFIRQLETLLERHEKELLPPPPASERGFGPTTAGLFAFLSLAIDCDGAAARVPEPLASRLRAVAARIDDRFCAMPHEVRAHRGFRFDADTKIRTPAWTAATGSHTTAQVGMMCVSRYDNSGRIGYRDLVLAAADAYLDSLPAGEADVWPGTFGHAISLQLAAWRHSANGKYLARARQLGDVAVERFWGTNALPRASLKTDHYESITGADTLALGLLELHLQVLHITAVRCPANTLDR